MKKFDRAVAVYRTEGLGGLTRRLKNRAYRVVVALQRGLRRPVVSSAYGIRLAANWQDTTFRFYVYGSYGNYLSDLIAGIGRDFHFMDIGANQGLYSILAARNPNCRGCVAFEPVPGTAALLRKNLALNAVSGSVEVIEAAVSGQVGRTVIHLNESHSGGASLRSSEGSTSLRAIEIELVDAVGLLRWRRIPGLPIVVKIDVEGHEPVVVKELLKSSLAEDISMIFYECDEAWLDAGSFETMLRDAGFRKFEKIGSGTHYDVLAQR
ncbi:FkbM family methyltransferase [Tabrizicola sp. TH137]|uniref:FkbM family methyltransferase n=1 Tax=Tabrizicola sp. TH137 TaxID=2067452 RepID=UPI000C7D6851|nr:FkbM family methyltransferase [Tabrizicola sp. TH137]PLL13204.1 FkbM family methyltransferase [Tabrizicola sp. TH137]